MLYLHYESPFMYHLESYMNSVFFGGAGRVCVVFFLP